MAVAVQRPRTDAAVVTVTGPLDYAAVGELEQALGDAVQSGATTLVVDASSKDAMDETAVGLLVRAVRAVPPHGTVVVALGDARAREALAAMGIDRLVAVVGERGEALSRAGLA